MIDDAQLDEYHALALKIAPEFALASLCLLRHVDGWQLPRGAVAYSVKGRHLAIRDELIRRGKWPGVWPCYVVFVEALDDAEAMLIVLLHELAHLLPATTAIPDDGPEPIAQQRELQVSQLAEWAAGGPPPVPWDGHGPEFIRVALHLHHRAQQAGVDVGLFGLCGGYASYALSHPAVYREELGDEPERMIGASFSEIEATPPPEKFSALFREDTEIYFERHPEFKIEHSEPKGNQQ